MKYPMLALLLAVCASSSHAMDCKNATTTADMNQCAAADQKKTEDQLNAVYKEVLAVYKAPEDAGVKAALVNAQRAWVKFREADCKAEYAKWQGGSIRNVMFSGCMRDRAEKRIKELQEFSQRG